MFHCWFVWPLQSQISTFVPAVVWLLYASRHFPRTCSCLVPVYVQRWFDWLVQSQMRSCTPLVVELFGSSRQRFEPTPRMTVAEPPVVGGGGLVLVVPPATRYMTTPWPGT